MTVPTQRADPPFAGHPGPVLAVAVTPDGTQIITTGADGTARIWDRASGQQVGPALTGHTGWVRAARLSASMSPAGRPSPVAAPRRGSVMSRDHQAPSHTSPTRNMPTWCPLKRPRA